jgi:hypothetical protein
VSLSSGDEVPHIFTRKSRLQPGEFLITSAKRLLQHNLPLTDITGASFDTFVGAQDEGYNSIPSLAGVFNLCDRRFDTRSGRMTWHLMKK